MIYDERGQEVRLKLGPYKVGDNVLLKCKAKGGNQHFSMLLLAEILLVF